MLRNTVRWSMVAASLLVAAAWPVLPVPAKTSHSYDLDSLIYLNTDVVEAEILRRYRAHGQDLIDVKVTIVHKGEFKKGQTVVVAGTYGYQKPKKDEGHNTVLLAPGDCLILFLSRAKATEYFRIPADAVIYVPLDGGIRLVHGDYVVGFSQRSNPGPDVANELRDLPKSELLTIERFRKQVRDGLRNTPEWARLLEAKEDQLDVPRLLKLLASRSRQSIHRRDYFTERICSRFAESHDPDLLSRALPLAKGWYDREILEHGFGTPKGRDYLLARVTNAKEPMEARLRYSYALHHAGEVYRSTFTNISTNTYLPVGDPDEGNSAYLTRIARAARDTVRHEELCNSLIRCVYWYGGGIAQRKPAPMMADLHGALRVLKELYDTKPTEPIQFAIETATANADRQAYEKLNSPCGPVISILLAADPSKYTKPKERSLIFEYSYTTTLLSRDVELQPSVVMVHQGSQKRVMLPWERRIRGGADGGGSGSVVLPEDLPPGRYHVSFQFTEGDKIISTGHYFAADL